MKRKTKRRAELALLVDEDSRSTSQMKDIASAQRHSKLSIVRLLLFLLAQGEPGSPADNYF